VDFVEPANFVVRGPKLASLVDINLARLLSIRLAKFLLVLEGAKTALEDASLTAKVCSTGQPERTREIDLCVVEHMPIWIIGKIKWIVACPICL